MGPRLAIVLAMGMACACDGDGDAISWTAEKDHTQGLLHRTKGGPFRREPP